MHCLSVWQPVAQHFPSAHASHTLPPGQSASEEHPPSFTGGLVSTGLRPRFLEELAAHGVTLPIEFFATGGLR